MMKQRLIAKSMRVMGGFDEREELVWIFVKQCCSVHVTRASAVPSRTF